MFTSSSWLIDKAQQWQHHRRIGRWVAGTFTKYSAFCEKYQQWSKPLKRSMRQTHEAGDKLFVDYAGQTVPLVDASTGEITQAQAFVAVLGASNFTYACATPTQKAVDWAPPPWSSSVACRACWCPTNRVRS
jgi:transposase